MKTQHENMNTPFYVRTYVRYLERRLGICRSIAYQLLMSPLANI